MPDGRRFLNGSNVAVGSWTANPPPDSFEPSYCTSSGRNRPPVDVRRCQNLPFERPVLASIADVRSLPSRSRDSISKHCLNAQENGPTFGQNN